MGADYIPERDFKAACWMKFFARGLVEHPELYRTTPEEAAAIEAVVTAFRIAGAKCWPRDNATRGMVAAKNAARKAAERLVRPAAQRIRTDPQIAAAAKIDIGLRPTAQRRRHVGPPQSWPIMQVTALLSGEIDVRVADSASKRAARPTGTIGFELHEMVRPRETLERGGSDTAGPETAGAGWRFVGMYSKASIRLCPATKQWGDEVQLVARWVTRRGEVGPFGQIAITRVSATPALSRHLRAA